MRILKFFLTFIIFCLLTILTQVGGLVYLFSILTYKFIDKWTKNNLIKATYRFVFFISIYCITTFLIVPWVAKPFGRVPLSLNEKSYLKPLNIMTCFLNRNYVRPELRQLVIDVAIKMNSKFPGTTTNYLDANFPFIDQFPLIPHLSHNDGKKLDLSFCYLDTKTGNATNGCPSFIGYGICEEPIDNENNMSDYCAKQGYWLYSILTKLVSQDNKQNFTFDSDRTRELINFFRHKRPLKKYLLSPI